MSPKRTISSFLEAVAVIIAVAVLATSVTYAALQSPAVSLTNNSISSAVADLRISTNGSTFTTPSTAGFNFTGVVPGGASAPAAGNTFYLQNVGTSSLSLRVSVTTTPSVTTTQPNGAGVDLSKVFFEFTRVDTGAVTSLSLKSLIDSNTTGSTAMNEVLAGGATIQYNLRTSMSADAFTAQSASITGINLSFTGIGT